MRFWRGGPAGPTTKITIATPYEQLLLNSEPGGSTAGILFREEGCGEGHVSFLAPLAALTSAVIKAIHDGGTPPRT